MLEFLTTIETEAKESRRKAMEEYRQLLTQAIPPATLDTRGERRVADLIRALGLSAGDVRRHAKALQDIRRIEDMQSRLAEAQERGADAEPALAAFVEKRQRILAELESEGGPIFATSAAAEREVQSLSMRLTGNGTEGIRNAHLEFFGIDPPNPLPQPNQTQAEESQRRMSAWHDFVRVQNILAALDRPRKITDLAGQDHTSVTLVFRWAAEENVDEMVWRPELGYPRLQDFAPGIEKDPRKAKILQVARQIVSATRKHEIFSIPEESKNLIFAGLQLGFLRGEMVNIHQIQIVNNEPDESEVTATA